MAATFVTLACCLLAFSSALTLTLGPTSSQTSNRDILNNGTTIPSSSTPNSTLDSNWTMHTTGSSEESMATTLATSASAENTSSLQTSLSTTPTTSKTTSVPSPTVTTATAEVTTQTKLTTTAEPATTATATPGGDTGSTSATTVNPVSSSHTVSAASPTTDGATDASRLDGSEKYITIVLSVTLGVVVVVLSVCTLSKCHNRRQFAHQPLDECGDLRTFVSDDDTLVISGGLYDAHPIYDNVPTLSDDQYEYRLEFYR